MKKDGEVSSKWTLRMLRRETDDPVVPLDGISAAEMDIELNLPCEPRLHVIPPNIHIFFYRWPSFVRTDYLTWLLYDKSH